MTNLTWAGAASEWIRAARGRLTQRALSSRLRYRSNIVYRWECGRCYPSAPQMLCLLESVGSNVQAGILAFYRSPPAWLESIDPCSASGVAALLNDLRGSTSFADLAKRTAFSRFSIARWMKAEAVPNLIEFMTLIDVMSHRLLDFIANFTDPHLLPSVAAAWESLCAARDAAYREPWSQAVLRALELTDYRLLPVHSSEWIGTRLGIPTHLVETCLRLLQVSGQVRAVGPHFEVTSTSLVDTRSHAARSRQLSAGWSRVALERLESGAHGILSYNLSTVSRRDYEKIEQLQRVFYRHLVGLIADSSPGECVLLYGAQLVDLAAQQPIDAPP